MKTGDAVIWNDVIWTILVELDDVAVYLERNGFEVLVNRSELEAIH